MYRVHLHLVHYEILQPSPSYYIFIYVKTKQHRSLLVRELEGYNPSFYKSDSFTMFHFSISKGSGSIQGFREDRRNLTKSMHPLYYGAYSTHGPSYDSTFANLTKEETELVHSTYCDPAGK